MEHDELAVITIELADMEQGGLPSEIYFRAKHSPFQTDDCNLSEMYLGRIDLNESYQPVY